MKCIIGNKKKVEGEEGLKCKKWKWRELKREEREYEFDGKREEKWG